MFKKRQNKAQVATISIFNKIKPNVVYYKIKRFCAKLFSSNNAKKEAYLFGITAEYVVIFWFAIKGYVLLHKRFRNKYGEIDLIFKRRNLIVFTEVKSRKSNQVGDAFDIVSEKQIARIKRAAEHFMLQNQQYCNHDMRFDLMIVTSLFTKPQHCENIWW
jgi:putative endonuclease